MTRKKIQLLLLDLLFLTSPLMAVPSLWDTIPREKTTIPVLQEREWWQPVVSRISDEVQQAQQVDVLFIGNSIVRGWRDVERGRRVWEENFTEKGIYAINSGVNGDRLENILYRNLHGNLDFKEGVYPKVVIFAAGTNNIDAGDDVQAVADGIRANIQLIRRRLPYSRIIVSGILPRVRPGNKHTTAIWLKKVRQVNDIVKNYTEAGMVTFVDCGDRFLTEDGKNVKTEYILQDGVHLTAEGYRVWMEALGKPLKEFLHAPPVKNIRIMPLGNSITSTLSDVECYRRYLDYDLHRAGIKFDFVGSRHWLRNESRKPVMYDYDWDHEGHWAREADWVLERVGDYARAARPDMVLMHIGTNDILHENVRLEEVVSQTLTDIGNIIDTLRSVNPNIRILLAQIIPTKRGGLTDRKIVALNEKLPYLAMLKNKKYSPVMIVNQWEGMDPKKDLHDSYHVNHSGALKMEKKWYEGIRKMLQVRAVEAEQIRLPAILGSNMVLQRNSRVPLWGQGKPGQEFKIRTSWDDKQYPVTVDREGKWRTEVTTGGAGGPYRIELWSDSVIMLENVLLGEVWICSGQSNMEMALAGRYGSITEGSADAIATAGRPDIHLFTVPHATSRKPLEECGGSWQVAAPATAARFSAAGWFFGTLLQESLGMPVGLIQTTVGGTPAQAWTPEKSLEKFRKEDILLHYEKYKRKTHYPSVLYNAMVHPLVPYRIRGVIWYQGESNSILPDIYKDLFSAMIRGWRYQWGYDFPFYFVQIAPFDYGSGCGGALVREAQLETMLEVPGTGMAVTMDIGEEKNIHPGKKKEVGHRLAYWALSQTYGFSGVPFTAPVYDSLEIKDTVAVVHFRYAGQGFYNPHHEIGGFEIAGKDRLFYPAHAVVGRGRKTVNVWSPEIKHPVAVRYCFRDWCEGALFGQNGLPVSSFRTDDWEIKRDSK